MKPMSACVAMVVAGLAAPVWAAPDESPSFDVRCRTSTADFTLQFQSKSGDVTEDDMAVTLAQGGKVLALGLRPGWYLPSGMIRDRRKLPSICRVAVAGQEAHEYPAFELAPDRVLLFFRLNARPGFDQASAILYDPKAMRVLDTREQIASIKEKSMVFRAIRGGVEQRLIREWLANSDCDCAESAIEDWQPIRLRGRKLELAWKPTGY